MILPSNILRECLDMVATQTDTVRMSPVPIAPAPDAPDTPKGAVRLAAYRQDRIALIDLTVEVTDPIGGPIGINVPEWSRALRSIEGDVTVISDNGLVTLSGGGYRFVVGDVTIDAGDVRLPDVPHTAETMVPISELRRIGVADPKRSDSMSISVTPQGTVLSSYDDKGIGVDAAISPEVSICDGDAASVYSLEAFVSFVRAAPADAVVTLSLAKDYPMTVTFGGRGYDGRWMLAPRIEEE